MARLIGETWHQCTSLPAATVDSAFEGEKNQVLTNCRTTSLDPRHRSVRILSQELIEELQFLLQTIGFRPLSKEAMKGPGAFEEFLVRTSNIQIKRVDASAQLFLLWLGEYRLAVTRYRILVDNCRRVQPADDPKSIPARALRPRASRPAIGASGLGTTEYRKCR
ncbi:hypothetical protein GCM10007382_27170 [Salinibacterium xinjiangense]|uniref:Uncharacterized protein n=1 Tax=Salinibacterium xinjiangense TaxID=386302 RepID=A0A2C8ZUT0_9MICO|nr:hypothetical protein [Salinibacterium xinjiangense]GGL05886.1 hypothetical protein GCM10007382_27170 [Salinibacterium xinjiangense]SOE69520.1 hypothetical protein SAMN06296378_1994 [Salinibacterium xinjiangense]